MLAPYGCEFELLGPHPGFKLSHLEESDPMTAADESSAQSGERIDMTGDRRANDAEMRHGRAATITLRSSPRLSPRPPLAQSPSSSPAPFERRPDRKGLAQSLSAI